MSDLYKKSGVDIEEGEKTVSKIKNILHGIQNKNVLEGIGGFGGLFSLDLNGIKNPVLVSSIDGVGTKLKIAFMSNKHDTVGEDLLNHCINDILVQGAKPLFFLDYIGTGRLSSDVIAEIIKGFARSCKKYNVALLGGETAEMPGFYSDNEYDIAGCITGIVDKDKIITGEKITAGDIIIGIPSTGLHTNGYSLARHIIFDIKKFKVDNYIDGLNNTIGEELLKVHRCYYDEVYPLLEKDLINGMAHITGGGFKGNIIRVLPDNICANINTKSWEPLTIFKLLKKWGNVETEEMYRVFNMGIGFILFVNPNNVDTILNQIKDAIVIGETTKTDKKAVNLIY